MSEIEAMSTAKEYADRVRELLDAKAIYLYGSHARGTSNKDSDIDIAVVVDRIDGDYLTTVSKLWGLSRTVSDEIEPVLILDGHDASGFLETIQRTGIAV